MRGYREIRMGAVWDGDVVTMTMWEYDDSIISDKWEVHFVPRKRFFAVHRATNNFLHVRSYRDKCNRYISYNDIEKAYRRMA